MPRHVLSTSPTGRSKQTLSNHLRPRTLKMCQEPNPVARRILTGPSAETQIQCIFAPGMHRGGRCTDAPSDCSFFHQAHLAASYRAVSSDRFCGRCFCGHHFRVYVCICAVAFVINVVAASSAHTLVGGSWASAPPSIASCPALTQP
jgi:hypothetical protein